jgi:hypothetical protein
LSRTQSLATNKRAGMASIHLGVISLQKADNAFR